VIRKAQSVVQSALERLESMGVTEEEMRRVFENELARFRAESPRALETRTDKLRGGTNE
jgi:hypothetical protein